MSLSSGDEVPHTFTRKSRLKPEEFLITSAKALLQQNLPQADFMHCNKRRVQFAGLRGGARVTSPPPHRSVRAAFPRKTTQCSKCNFTVARAAV